MPFASVERKRILNVKAALKGTKHSQYALDLIKFCNLEHINWWQWRDGANNTLNIDLKTKNIFIKIKNKLEYPDIYYKNKLETVIEHSEFCIIISKYLFLFQFSPNAFMRCYNHKYVFPLNVKQELLEIVFKIVKRYLDNAKQKDVSYMDEEIMMSSLPTSDDKINKKLKEIVDAQR